MTETAVAATGLRERGKARRRAAIQRAAYQLFAERGYAATTIADIAATAEVAPRTVAMYFPAKQDIALSRFSEAIDELTEALQQRRPGQTMTGVLGAWLRARNVDPEERELSELGHRMFEASPELRALRTARMAEAVREGAAMVAAAIGSTPDAPGPRLAAVASAALMTEVLDSNPGPERDQAVAIAIGFLEAGLRTLGARG